MSYYKSLEKEIDTGKKLNEFTFSQPHEPDIDELLIENENNNEEIQEEENDEGEIEPIEPRRSTQTLHPSIRLCNHVAYKVKYLIQNFLSYQHVMPEYKAFLTVISKEIELNNYQEAITNPTWCKAMQEEIKALEINKTWIIIQLPKEKKICRL
jgi:hypothetical protein